MIDVNRVYVVEILDQTVPIEVFNYSPAYIGRYTDKPDGSYPSKKEEFDWIPCSEDEYLNISITNNPKLTPYIEKQLSKQIYDLLQRYTLDKELANQDMKEYAKYI